MFKLAVRVCFDKLVVIPFDFSRCAQNWRNKKDFYETYWCLLKTHARGQQGSLPVISSLSKITQIYSNVYKHEWCLYQCKTCAQFLQLLRVSLLSVVFFSPYLFHSKHSNWPEITSWNRRPLFMRQNQPRAILVNFFSNRYPVRPCAKLSSHENAEMSLGFFDLILKGRKYLVYVSVAEKRLF